MNWLKTSDSSSKELALGRVDSGQKNTIGRKFCLLWLSIVTVILADQDIPVSSDNCELGLPADCGRCWVIGTGTDWLHGLGTWFREISRPLKRRGDSAGGRVMGQESKRQCWDYTWHLILSNQGGNTGSIHVVVHGIMLGHGSKGYGERSYYETRKKVERRFGCQIVLVFHHQKGMRRQGSQHGIAALGYVCWMDDSNCPSRLDWSVGDVQECLRCRCLPSQRHNGQDLQYVHQGVVDYRAKARADHFESFQRKTYRVGCASFHCWIGACGCSMNGPNLEHLDQSNSRTDSGEAKYELQDSDWGRMQIPGQEKNYAIWDQSLGSHRTTTFRFEYYGRFYMIYE